MGQTTQQQGAATRGRPPNLTVLMVDDDEQLCAALRARLPAQQHALLSCNGLSSALALMREGLLPDLLVVDLGATREHARDFQLEKSAEPRWAAIPVIALTELPTCEDDALEARVYLPKPVDPLKLTQTLERLGEQLVQGRALARAHERQRLTALGDLLGGIAYEINNPLAMLGRGLDSLQRQLAMLADSGNRGPFAVAAALRALERSRESAERIGDVFRCASMFAFADLDSEEALDVHQVLESSIQIASNELRQGAHLVRSYEDVPAVKGNAAKLGQVFLNLLLNAVHAIRDNGGMNHVVRVCTSIEDDCVVIAISDSATEVTPGYVSWMFDPMRPFMTGKSRVNFSLMVSREIVSDMGGRLELTALEPQGASFQIILPAHTRESLPAPAPKPPVRWSTGRPSVAVVDDEPAVCELLGAQLAEHYDVVTFCSARAAAVALLDGGFDAILCDVVMPELSGLELFDAVTRQRPELAGRFLFITGGSFTERARLFFRAGGHGCLRKPCLAAELVQAVEAVVSAAVSEHGAF